MWRKTMAPQNSFVPFAIGAKNLYFASDRGELGVKLKLQVQESDTIS